MGILVFPSCIPLPALSGDRLSSLGPNAAGFFRVPTGLDIRVSLSQLGAVR